MGVNVAVEWHKNGTWVSVSCAWFGSPLTSSADPCLTPHCQRCPTVSPRTWGTSRLWTPEPTDLNRIPVQWESPFCSILACM